MKLRLRSPLMAKTCSTGRELNKPVAKTVVSRVALPERIFPSICLRNIKS
jgi:hypothetical protein